MNFYGLILGVMSFLIIGIWHPIVIKGEYYWGSKKCTPIFIVVGAICVLASLMIDNIYISVCLALFGFSAWWGVKEVKEQEQRVAKGWFPKNPNKK